MSGTYVGSKVVPDDGEHVLCWKRRDLLWLHHGRALQFSKTFEDQFDQVPSRWWRVLKIVVYVINSTQVRL